MSNEHSGPGRLLRRFVGMIVAFATLLVGLAIPGTAMADARPDDGVTPAANGFGYPGINIKTFNGKWHYVGVIGKISSGGKLYNAYCMDWGIGYNGEPIQGGTLKPVTSEDGNRVAYLATKYANNYDDTTQAALAYLIHDKIDNQIHNWSSDKGQFPLNVVQRAQALWNEAMAEAPTAAGSFQYTTGKRKGEYSVKVKNGNGQPMVGKQVTLTISGPAVFDGSGSNTITVTTGADGSAKATWTANGDGAVSITPSVAGMMSGSEYVWPRQHMFISNLPGQGTPIGFEVLNQFTPEIKTEASNTFDHAGDTRPVHDTIYMSGFGGFEDEQITGTVTLNWDGYPDDYVVDQKVDKTFTTNWVPELQSPDFTPADFGWTAWKGGRYWFDVKIPQQGHMSGPVDTDDREPKETWKVDAPSITTDVSKRVVGINEKFYDTAKITGRLAAGTYVIFTAYDAVPDLPDTSANVLLEERVDIPPDLIEKSYEQGSITIRSKSISADHVGYVYWKATLYNNHDDVLDTHDLGIETETVHVLPLTVDTKVGSATSTPKNLTFGEKFGDKATFTGIIEPGSYVLFEAFGPTLDGPNDNDGNPVASVLGKKLYSERINVTQTEADNSHSTPQVYCTANFPGTLSVNAEDHAGSTTSIKRTGTQDKECGGTSTGGTKYGQTPEMGFVYWRATMYGPDGKIRVTHELGLENETIRLEMPTIETQVSNEEVAVGDEFHDVASIYGKVARGSYVTFTAYEAQPTDTPNANAPKILDEARVDITNEQADQSSAKDHFKVVSPKVSTMRSGWVFWVATLHTASGQILDQGKLGEETEKLHVRGGGIIASHAQAMGAVGGQLYDEVQVWDESVGHEGDGNGNSHDFYGKVPNGSYVTVRLYRNDGHAGQTKGQMIGQIRRDLDDSKWQLSDPDDPNSPRTQIIKVTGQQFVIPECPTDGYQKPGQYNPCGAGMYYFVATLYNQEGQVLDKGTFGESGDAHETGYPSEERTPVQKFETERAKKWFSIDAANYADKTITTYDMLKQYAYQVSDVDVDSMIAQTDPGTTMRFEIWREDPESKDGATDVKVWKGKDWTLPSVQAKTDGSAGVLKWWQKLKSENVDLTDRNLFPVGTYYYRAVIQNPDVDSNPVGTTSIDPDYNPSLDGNTNVVWYDAKRVKAESFDIIEAQSKSAEPLWTDAMHVADTITLSGVIPKGTQYEAEIWKAEPGLDGKVIGTEKVASTGRLDVPAEAIGDFRLKPVTFTTKWLKNPGVGSYQWRFKIWTPDNKGGDVELPKGSFSQPQDTDLGQKGEARLDDNWESVPQEDDKTNPDAGKNTMHGYHARWLIFDGMQVKDEHFEIVKITTDVTKSQVWSKPQSGDDDAKEPAGNAQQTPDGENWINTSYEGANVQDHADIAGHMLENYKLGFTLYKKAPGEDRSKDTVVYTTLLEVLHEGQQTVESAKYWLKKNEYGDYYWRWNFRKPDEQQFNTDKVLHGETKDSDSAKAIKEESFHAVSITTATYDWGAVANKLWDTAFIHGKLPEDAMIHFELKDKTTGKTVQSTKPVKVGETDANGTTAIESEHIELKKAGDYYWSEVVELPGKHDKPFHTGRDDQEPESLHGISANTTTVSEVMAEQSNVHDDSTLENIAEDGRLMASWDLYKVDQTTNDPYKDTYVTTVDGDGQPLKKGQTKATSPSVDILAHYKGDWKQAVGEYYWVLRVWDKAPTTKDSRLDLYGEPGDNGGDGGSWAPDKPTVTPDGVSHPGESYRIVHTGKRRDKMETFRVIHAETKAVSEEEVGKTVRDQAIIYGPVARNTKLSWSLFEHIDDKQPVEAYEDYHTITADEAETARVKGVVSILGPEFKTEKVGTLIWQLALKRPLKVDTQCVTDTDGSTGNSSTGTGTGKDDCSNNTGTGNGNCSTGTGSNTGNGSTGTGKDDCSNGTSTGNGNCSTGTGSNTGNGSTTTNKDNDCLSDTTEKDYFFEDTIGHARETTQIVRVTTRAVTKAKANTWFHDTALIEGQIVKGTQIGFDLYLRVKGDDASKDKHILSTDRVTLQGGETTVDSPNVKVAYNGDYYWVETVYRPTDQDHPTNGQVELFHTGQRRLPNETTRVWGGLAQTGMRFSAVFAGVLGILAAGALAIARRRMAQE